jgi:hypothetical protein
MLKVGTKKGNQLKKRTDQNEIDKGGKNQTKKKAKAKANKT